MEILAELQPKIIEHFHVDMLPLEADIAVWADAGASHRALLGRASASPGDRFIPSRASSARA